MRIITFKAITRLRNENESTAKEAMNGDEIWRWRLAMQEEVDSLRPLDCWKKLQIGENQNVLHTKFLFKNVVVTVEKYNARLVVRVNEENESV